MIQFFKTRLFYYLFFLIASMTEAQATNDMSFEVRSLGAQRVRLMAREKQTRILDEVIDLSSFSEKTVQGCRLQKSGHNLFFHYKSPSSAASLKMLVRSNGDMVLLGDETTHTLHDQYWRWTFQTRGIIENTGNLIFYILDTNAHAFHNYGIIKALTGNLKQNYLFNQGVFDFGDHTTPIDERAYPFYIIPDDVAPHFTQGEVHDHGIFLSQKGLKVDRLTYKSHGLFHLGGSLTCENHARFENHAKTSLIEGRIQGVCGGFLNTGEIYVTHIEPSHLFLSHFDNQGSLYLDQPSSITPFSSFESSGIIHGASTLQVKAPNKPKNVGGIVASNLEVDLSQGMDPEGKTGKWVSRNGKTKIRRIQKTNHLLNTITKHYVNGQYTHTSETGYILQRTTEEIKEEEIDNASANQQGISLMDALHAMRRLQLKAIQKGIQDALKKLAILNGNKNDLLYALFKSLSAAGLSNDAIADLLEDPELQSLLDGIGSYDIADPQEKSLIADATTDSGSLIQQTAQKAQTLGMSVFQYVKTHHFEWADNFCNVITLATARAPVKHPVLQALSGLCGGRSLALQFSGGRFSPKVKQCLVDNPKPQAYFREQQKVGAKGPENPRPGKAPEQLNTRVSNVKKQESPVWRELKPFRGNIKTNGEQGNNKKFYQWDHTHNDIEVYGPGGREHLGSLHPITGKIYKPGVPGRSIRNQIN